MTQTSRQALVELLFLALYLDDFLSLAEDELLGKALDALGWESATSREIFIFSAFSAAREAAACPVKTQKFVDERADILHAAGEEAAAMTWMHKILASDGLTASEERFLGQLQARLYPDSPA
jgi:hypothetical protein